MAKLRKDGKPKLTGRGNNQIKRDKIDFELVNKLCAIGCTMKEVSAALDLSHDQIEIAIKENFAMGWKEYFNAHNDKFKVSLRRLQMRSAEGEVDDNTGKYAVAPSVPMQIWLGKQFLGQSDKQEQKIEEKTNIPMFDWGKTEDVDHEDLTGQKEIKENNDEETD